LRGFGIVTAPIRTLLELAFQRTIESDAGFTFNINIARSTCELQSTHERCIKCAPRDPRINFDGARETAGAILNAPRCVQYVCFSDNGDFREAMAE
jgi:hypothetical protein